MATPRRDLLKIGGLVTVSLLVSQKSFAAWASSERYPDSRIVAVDDSFRRYMFVSAKVERIASGSRWAEDPVWFGDMRMLLWSDTPDNAIMRWDEISRETNVFRYPANYSNGHAYDRQGRLISCEYGTRRIMRTEYDGSATVLAGSHQGKRLNSPSDIVVRLDGTIRPTDPPFGISGFYEGHKATPELSQNIYCLESEGYKLGVVLGDIKGPNGLCFPLDGKALHVVESRATPNRLILVRDAEGSTLKNKRAYLDCGNGTADGIVCDADGNLWCGWGNGNEELDGVWISNPQGKYIGTIQPPERCANLYFGGEQRNRLLMVSSTSIYSLYVNAQGAKLV